MNTGRFYILLFLRRNFMAECNFLCFNHAYGWSRMQTYSRVLLCLYICYARVYCVHFLCCNEHSQLRGEQDNLICG